MLSLAQAPKNETQGFTGAATRRPKFIGRRVGSKRWTWRRSPTTSIGVRSSKLGTRQAPSCDLEDEVVGEAAAKFYAEGQAMLKKIIEGRWLTANGVVALLPANTVNDDDIEIYRRQP